MTKIIILFAFLITGLCARAQLDKGTWLGGGNGSFYTYTEKFDDPNYYSEKYTDIQIFANIGYFIIDKLAVGVNPSFSFKHGEQIGTDIYYRSPTIFAIGPFIRYYILDKEKQFNLLIDSRFTVGTIRSPPPSYYHKGNQYRFSAMVGPEIFLNTSIGIEFLMGYNFAKEKIYSDVRHTTTNSGFKAAIGLQLHLEKL